MAKAPTNERRYQGLAVSPGVALARVCLFRDAGRHQDLPVYHVDGEGKAQERARLERALAIVHGRLKALQNVVAGRIGAAEAEIFVAQRMILDDPEVRRRIDEALDEGYNAEAAAMKVLDAYETRLQQVDHAYLKDRASDIGELKRRLMDALMDTFPTLLCAAEPHCRRGKDRIIATEELTPAMTLDLDSRRVRAFVTSRGGVTSHAAILARALGIPAVTGLDGFAEQVSCGTEVLVNGHTGEVVVWPGAEARRALEAEPVPSRIEAVEPVPGLAVMANVSMASEIREAVATAAEGIGLYRTEFEFFAAGRMLSEDEQAERYAEVLEAMEGRPVHFRLLDIGGDKPSPLFTQPPEENPQLGCRGARYLLTRPDVLATQARALARASRTGPVRVMYPMIVEAEQMRRLRRVFEEAVEDVPHGRIEHGVMFEVPSACLEAEALLRISDFASIGTNDLIQYLFAVDRNNDRVAYDYHPDRGVFWRVLEQIARAADAAGKPVSVCGEMAAEARHVARFIEAGIRTLSVGVRHVSRVRMAARRILEEETAV